MSERVYNFAAGPAVMPEEVLKKAASELVCYQDTGMSVMEMSHRGAAFSDVYKRQDTICMALPYLRKRLLRLVYDVDAVGHFKPLLAHSLDLADRFAQQAFF